MPEHAVLAQDDVERVDGAAGKGLDPGLLEQFPGGGGAHGLAGFDMTAGKAPEARIGFVPAADEQDLIAPQDDGQRGKAGHLSHARSVARCGGRGKPETRNGAGGAGSVQCVSVAGAISAASG
ncbi:hypothetical protein GCM10011534_34480 [Pseudooceanicola nanhaiensis]|uniref:Uncharacterized protein n=1 Tax=Pseudooceanicola nanhaiensis TaxID=375761 RepID=A0A917WK73_9RHOB|nr:hypothetical protein GCM10011534_34480 [Pseudooceanicola nanhaiensis]